MHTSIYLAEISMYGTMAQENIEKGNLAAILFMLIRWSKTQNSAW